MYTPFNPSFGADLLLSRDPLRTARNRLLSRTVAPAAEPLTLAEVKLYLRLDHYHEDTLLIIGFGIAGCPMKRGTGCAKGCCGIGIAGIS